MRRILRQCEEPIERSLFKKLLVHFSFFHDGSVNVEFYFEPMVKSMTRGQLANMSVRA